MTFNEIPANNMVPMFYTEFDNTNAVKSGAMPWKNLLIGQPLSTKATYNGKLVQIRSDEQADAYYGEGSQLALMARAFRKNSKTSELWVLAVSDASDSAAASGKITATVSDENGLPYAGAIRLMIGGQAVAVNVAALDDASGVATKIAAAINANSNLPVSASAAAAVVTLTAKNKGTCGHGIDIRYNHYQGEELPECLTLAITAMANGGADPVYTAANVGNIIDGTWFNAIAIGSSESSNVNYLKGILNERWTATVQQTGVVFAAVTGSASDCETEGKKYNSQVVVVPSLPKTPTPAFEVAAAVLGVIAPISSNDANGVLSNYAVAGVIAPKAEDRLGLTGNNDLLKNGCALLTASDDGTVYIKRIVTTYRTTANGASDTSYQQLETVFALSFIRWDWNNYMAGKYPHAKLADDGNDFGPGQVIMTPNLGKGELLGRYEYWMSKGIVQNYESFKANLVVMRDADDNTALQFLIPAELVSQFFIGKSKILFK